MKTKAHILKNKGESWVPGFLPAGLKMAITVSWAPPALGQGTGQPFADLHHCQLTMSYLQLKAFPACTE